MTTDKRFYRPPLGVWILVTLWTLPFAFTFVRKNFDGFTLGYSIVNILYPLVLAYIVAQVVYFFSKRSQRTATVFFALIFVLLALQIVFVRITDPKLLQKRAIGGSFSATLQECKTLVRAWPVLLEIEKQLTQEQKQATTDLQRLDAEINTDSFSDVNTLKSKEDVGKRIAVLQIYSATWKKLADFLIGPTDSTATKMQQAGIPGEGIRRATLCLKKGMEDGLTKSPIKSAEIYLALAAARQEECKYAIEMFSVLENKWGAWEAQDGLPVFQEPSDLDAFNEAASKMSNATTKAAELVARAGSAQ